MTGGYIYKILDAPTGRTVGGVITTQSLDLKGLLETFRMDYGFYDSHDHQEKIFRIRQRLSEQRGFLKLETDPMVDALGLVFADWCAKQKGGSLLYHAESMDINGKPYLIHEFIFRL